VTKALSVYKLFNCCIPEITYWRAIFDECVVETPLNWWLMWGRCYWHPSLLSKVLDLSAAWNFQCLLKFQQKPETLYVTNVYVCADYYLFTCLISLFMLCIVLVSECVTF